IVNFLKNVFAYVIFHSWYKPLISTKNSLIPRFLFFPNRAYITDESFRDIFKKNELGRLEIDYRGIFSISDYNKLKDNKLNEKLPSYIDNNVDLTIYAG
ncbi:MAG: hypothetical protein LBM19_03415, partial [Holosporales bacterium]|nr:hypothetical protein [Holosporales bacterium]